ncbi:uncharacterized protein BO88DRAFT_431584 [Aspergillus vadensis CBS 113365]|uniref:Uncharacterized protein n=1 Tax=Aspergillus vadensis (strain CBS 113365 / IMI 142717 / IBT 24658) TaxID=1448311 RepID=A0A319D5A8_ASPVC|nr:hypothetical protein BO88DRAFT_431584 [Aspergillus vadensis CBS 113365]PYH75182.1 hypothetical protein BO88DRAFT_431584 [Aspergillus vadensis CBS 113365]
MELFPAIFLPSPPSSCHLCHLPAIFLPSSCHLCHLPVIFRPSSGHTQLPFLPTMARESKKRCPRKPLTCEDAWRKIANVGLTIIKTKSLRNGKDERVVALTIKSLHEKPTSKNERRFHDFLVAVRSRCSQHDATAIFIVSVAIGKDKMIGMNNSHRDALLDRLEHEQSGPILSSPTLREIAKSCGIPTVRNNGQQPILLIRSRPDSHGTTYEHAVLEGITAVFSEDLCNIISKVPTPVKGETSWRAAVTTAFPLYGDVNCLMSLDICSSGIDYLALELFNAKINTTSSLRYIVIDDGPTLIVPVSESTIKGVKEEAIAKVFGVEIHKAIRDSRVRRMELEQGKELTECVSMIMMERGAIVNLSLDLDCGIELSRKLYT